MFTFTLLPALVVIAFLLVVVYKHFIKKDKQNLKASFLFVLLFAGIWGAIYYFVFS